MTATIRACALIAAWIACSSALAAEYKVNTLVDTDDGSCDAGHCSLREAWSAAAATVDADEIKFNVKGSGPYAIALNPALPGFVPTANPVFISGKNRGEAVTVTAANYHADELFVFDGAAQSTIKDFRLVGFGRAIKVDHGANVVIERNEFDDNVEAIGVGIPWDFDPDGSTVSIAHNSIRNGSYGINIWTASVNIEHNNLDGLTDYGMLIVFAIDHHVFRNVISNCGRALHYEFDVEGLGDKQGIQSNTLIDNSAGIYFAKANDLRIEDNDIRSSSAEGIGVTQGRGFSTRSIIRNNRMIGLDEGVLLLDDYRAVVEDNYIERARTGIANYYGWRTEIRNNRIIDSIETGLAIANDSRVNLVHNNLIQGSGQAGIYVGQAALEGSQGGPFLGPDLIVLEDNVVSNGGGSGIVVSKDIVADCEEYNVTNGTEYLCPRLFGLSIQPRVNIRGNSVFDNGTNADNQAILLTTGIMPYGSTGTLVGGPRPCSLYDPCNPLENDPLDADDGANGLQNHPQWSDVRVIYADTILMSGSLASEPGERYRIDFYASPAPDEARTHLGHLVTDVTDTEGEVEFAHEAQLTPVDYPTRDGNLYLTMTASRIDCDPGTCPDAPFEYDPLFDNIGDEYQQFDGTSELSDSYPIANPGL